MSVGHSMNGLRYSLRVLGTLKCICILEAQEPRIRGNLQGKRVNFSARTVITSDPTIDMNQLRVPIKIATTLTIPEVVTPQNIEKLAELVKNGRDKYPGANFVFPVSNLESGRRVLPIDLRYRKEKVDLRYGDIVERHIVNGDIVLLNRQPTLHKLSMMGHRIVVINDEQLNTFGLSLCTCAPYNADQMLYIMHFTTVKTRSATIGYYNGC